MAAVHAVAIILVNLSSLQNNFMDDCEMSRPICEHLRLNTQARTLLYM